MGRSRATCSGEGLLGVFPVDSVTDYVACLVELFGDNVPYLGRARVDYSFTLVDDLADTLV